MKQFVLTLTLTLWGLSSLFAQIPAGYYDDAQGLSGAALKTELYGIIDNHNSQSYNSLWDHFYYTDRKANGKVWDMYSDVPGGTPPYQYTFFSDQCGSYSGEGICYNREHSFVKSWFGNTAPMNTDLFHLYPTDGYVNGQRNNLPFGETDSPSWTSQNGSKKGTSSFPGYSGTVFEPIDEYKGDFARTYFYMATRYEDKIDNWNSPMLNGTEYPAYTDWALDLLITWNNQDPVSEKETNRNNEIYDIQDNRNPYIDHPEYVALVWGGTTPPMISNITYAPEIPEAMEDVVVTAQITDNGTLTETLLIWGTSATALNNEETMNGSGTTYTATIPGQVDGLTVYFKVKATDDESLTSLSSLHSFTVNAQPGTIALPFSEDFEDGTLGLFFEKSAIGPDQTWRNSDFEDNHYAKMSNYDGDENVENEDWLLTLAINFDNYENETIHFLSAMKDYDGSSITMELLYSTDYSGEGDPNNATWTDISDRADWSPGEYEFVNSGTVSLTDLEGTFVTLAFKYSAPNGATNGRTWEIDDINVEGNVSVVEQASEVTFQIYPNPTSGTLSISSNSTEKQTIIIHNQVGTVAYEQQGYFTNNTTLNLSDLNRGMYFITLINRAGERTTKKLIIQ